MSRDDLRQYQINKQLIASHKAELTGNITTTDTVVGSEADFPYIEQVVSIHGVDEKRAQELRERIYDLSQQCERVEAFVASVEDEYMRSLLYWHYLRGLSWPKVRKTLGTQGITTDYLRKKTMKFLEKYR